MINFDLLPVMYQYVIKSMSFLSKLAASPSVLIKLIAEHTVHEDIFRLCRSCDNKCTVDSFIRNYKKVVYDHFISS